MRHGVRPRWPPASGYGLLVEIEDFEIEISSGDEGFGFELSMFGRVARITEVYHSLRARSAPRAAPRSATRSAPRSAPARSPVLYSRQGGRAEAAGLESWDRVKSVNGTPLFETRDVGCGKSCLWSCHSPHVRLPHTAGSYWAGATSVGALRTHRPHP